MRFSVAYNYLKRGHDIKLPEWGGYWYWNNESESIHIYTRDGEDFDIRESKEVDYTFGFINRDDWELADMSEYTVKEDDTFAKALAKELKLMDLENGTGEL